MTEQILPGQHAKYSEAIKGWYCNKCQRYFGAGKNAEEIAGKCCATVGFCKKCSAMIDRKHAVECYSCRKKRELEQWLALEEVQWDEEYPLTEYRGDNWFADESSLLDHLADMEEEERDLRLVTSKPIEHPHFDFRDYFCDSCLSDDYGEYQCLPEGWQAVEDAVNDLMKGHIGGYTPSDKRVSVEPYLKVLDLEST